MISGNLEVPREIQLVHAAEDPGWHSDQIGFDRYSSQFRFERLVRLHRSNCYGKAPRRHRSAPRPSHIFDSTAGWASPTLVTDNPDHRHAHWPTDTICGASSLPERPRSASPKCGSTASPICRGYVRWGAVMKTIIIILIGVVTVGAAEFDSTDGDAIPLDDFRFVVQVGQCAGTLINVRSGGHWVLVSRKCIDGHMPNDLFVIREHNLPTSWIGVNSMKSSQIERSQCGSIIYGKIDLNGVRRVVPHPHYDVALIQLWWPIQRTESEIRAVELADMGFHNKHIKGRSNIEIKMVSYRNFQLRESASRINHGVRESNLENPNLMFDDTSFRSPAYNASHKRTVTFMRHPEDQSKWIQIGLYKDPLQDFSVAGIYDWIHRKTSEYTEIYSFHLQERIDHGHINLIEDIVLKRLGCK